MRNRSTPGSGADLRYIRMKELGVPIGARQAGGLICGNGGRHVRLLAREVVQR